VGGERRAAGWFAKGWRCTETTREASAVVARRLALPFPTINMSLFITQPV